MTDDQFVVIGRDEPGSPHVRYCLDPREVTIIRDPERGDEIIGYIWEPVGPVPSPVGWQTELTDEQFEDFRRRFEEARMRPVQLLTPGWQVKRSPWWRRWSSAMYAGMGVAFVAIVWLYLALAFASSSALTPPAFLGLGGAVITGVGVFGPEWERRRRRRSR